MPYLTYAQRVNRVVEQAASGKRACQWAVFTYGTVVMLSGASMVTQTQLAKRAGEVLQTYSLVTDIYAINRVKARLIVDLTLEELK